MNRYEGYIDPVFRERGVYLNGSPFIFTFEQPNWGYCGKGPELVAESIMVIEFGVGVGRGLINLFKEEVIARLAGRDGWVLTSADIQSWYEKERVA